MDPIRTSNGFHILGIRDKRTVTLSDAGKASVTLMQAFRPYGATTNKTTLTEEAEKIRAAVKSCDDLESTLSGFRGWKAQKLGEMLLSKAPPSLADKITDIQAGSSTPPLTTDKGAAILFVCNRTEGGDIDRDSIMRSIGTEKMELLSRRLLRDMRRSAYLDIRIGR